MRIHRLLNVLPCCSRSSGGMSDAQLGGGGVHKDGVVEVGWSGAVLGSGGRENAVFQSKVER